MLPYNERYGSSQDMVTIYRIVHYNVINYKDMITIRPQYIWIDFQNMKYTNWNTIINISRLIVKSTNRMNKKLPVYRPEGFNYTRLDKYSITV